MPGGFLGVDVFFVISGYLITSLLLSEYRHGGHIKVGKFWARRARRLLPAVGVFIAVTMIVAAIVEPARIDALRGDALASLLYVANWHFIYSHQSYFEQFQTPSLFRHLWSLSVEEQFYLFWPLAFAAECLFWPQTADRRCDRRSAGIGGFRLDSLSPRRRCLARLLRHRHPRRRPFGRGRAGARCGAPGVFAAAPRGAGAGRLLDLAGLFALAYILASFLRVHDYDLSLYHGGYLALAAVTCVLIAVLAHPAARLGQALARRPLIWLGLRSYSFYLWHWPVLVLTPVIGISLDKGLLIPLQLLLVLILADLSYRFVELPFRGKTKPAALPADWLRVGRPALLVAVLAVVGLIGWGGFVGGGARSCRRVSPPPQRPNSPRSGPERPAEQSGGQQAKARVGPRWRRGSSPSATR